MPQVRAKNWFYTLNNYTDDELAVFSGLPSGASFHLFGKEVGESGTPHLQGVVGYPERVALQRVKNDLSQRMHLEPTRSVAKSVQYCSKEGDVSSFGTVPTGPTCGKRSDLDEFKTAVKEGVLSHKRLREDHSEVMAKYPRFCNDYVRDHLPKRVPELHPLRPWQQDVYGKLARPADSRTIVFVVDLRGNQGKSWFADYVEYLKGDKVQVLTPGKKTDMCMALREDISILFLDAPRSKQGEFIHYDFLEDIKNGRVFSGKYESGMKRLGPVHVIVMMNEYPDMTKLSEDRYEIIEL